MIANPKEGGAACLLGSRPEGRRFKSCPRYYVTIEDRQAILNRQARRSLIQRVSQKRRFSMNQRPTGLNVTKAITGFLQYKSAEGLSPVTVTGYDHDLKLWIEYQGDMDVAQVETTHILAYLNYLRTDYVPRRITGNNDKKLSPKTVYNLYISIASFFTWASREFNLNNPMKGITYQGVETLVWMYVEAAKKSAE